MNDDNLPKKFGTDGVNWLNAFRPNFPTEFSDALTYYQELKIAYDKMRECLHYLKTHEEQMMQQAAKICMELIKKSESKLNNKIDSEISELDKNLNALISSQIQLVQLTIKQIANEMDRFETETQEHLLNLRNANTELTVSINSQLVNITDDISQIESCIIRLESEMNNFKSHVNGMFQAELEKLLDKIDEQIARIQGDRIIVTNPLNGKKEGLGHVLEELSDYKNPYPITYEQFNALQITYNDFNDRKITYNDFNNFAGLIFLPDTIFPPILAKFELLEARIKKIEDTKWVSYITGTTMTPFNAYRELATYFIDKSYNPIPYVTFNELEIPVEKFNDANISIENFNLNGNEILPNL